MARAQNGLSLYTAGAADALQREVVSLREKAECIVGELASRGRHALDLRAQIKEHLSEAAWIGGGLVVVGAGVFAWQIVRWRTSRTRKARARRKLAGWGRLLMAPEKVLSRPKNPPLLGRLVQAALLAVATAALKTVAEHQAQRMLARAGR